MRYLLFIGSDYYPSGGWNDFVAAYPTLEAAIAGAAHRRTGDWWHIVHLDTLRVVESGPKSVEQD